tara:strand:- start:3118 stop:4563 length:1446 start_codon:yes stop_codon:yes gene_type:complete
MKTSAFKIIKSRLNKRNFYKLKNQLNKKTILIGILIIFVLAVFSYLVRPLYFNYQAEKENFESKIYNDFKIKSKINGDISYEFFPSPRIVINNLALNLGENSKERIKINKLYILISPLSLKNLDTLKSKKILILNQKIKIYPKNLKNLFMYFTIHGKRNLEILNSEIFFLDEQKNQVTFTKFNLTDNFLENQHKINISTDFSENKIRIKFLNKIGSEKYLTISVPNLKQSMDIKFDSTSSLQNLSGEMKLKILQTVLLLNFKGKDNFIISKSYLRNKFLNSKIDGKISFKDEFYFDLNMDVNSIDLKKLFLYYPILEQGNVSKKINGRIKLLIKSTNSLFGKIKNVKAILKMENGDIGISNFSAILPEKSKIKADVSIINTTKGPIIEFATNFSTNDAIKFFRKLGFYGFEQNEFSLFLDGIIDLSTQKIKFKKIIKNNNEKINDQEILLIEKNLNLYVLDEGINGLFDFFKIKKLVQEIN